jgi:glutamyl-tRNA synthetase
VLPWRDAFRQNPATPETVDDFVLWRADGVPSYQLAVVVDDLAMGITEVVRGDDLTDSTPRQLALIQALGGESPAYRHVPLVLDDAGRRLAKRSGSTQIAELRERGVHAEQLIGLLAASAGLLSVAEPVKLASLTDAFAWERVIREPVTIPEDTLTALSSTSTPASVARPST